MRRAEEDTGGLTVRSYLGLAGLAFLALAAVILFSGGIYNGPDVSTTTDVTPATAGISDPARSSTTATAPTSIPAPPASAPSAPSPPAGTAAPIPTVTTSPPAATRNEPGGTLPVGPPPASNVAPRSAGGQAPVQSSSPPATTEATTTTSEPAQAGLVALGTPCTPAGAQGVTILPGPITVTAPCVCTAGVWQLA